MRATTIHRALTLAGLSIGLIILVPLGTARSHEAGFTHDHAAQAGDDHAHESPHGGLVMTAGDYHLELLVDGMTYAVYLTDESMAAVPLEGVSGQITVLLDGGPAMLPLTATEDRLEATSEQAIPDQFVAVVQLTIGDDSATGRFSYDAAAAAQEHEHGAGQEELEHGAEQGEDEHGEDEQGEDEHGEEHGEEHGHSEAHGHGH